jgi:hypothetical protein
MPWSPAGALTNPLGMLWPEADAAFVGSGGNGGGAPNAVQIDGDRSDVGVQRGGRGDGASEWTSGQPKEIVPDKEG